MPLSRLVKMQLALEDFPYPEGIELWRTPEIAPPDFISLAGSGHALLPMLDESGAPTSTVCAYLKRTVNEPIIKGMEIVPIEIHNRMTVEDLRTEIEKAVRLLQENMH